MSDITFIVANKRANSGVQDSVVGSKYFADCTVTISHNFSNSVTEHPVEDGVSFSDHVQNRNARFTVSGEYSDIPLNQYSGDQLPLIDRVKAAYTFLRGLRDNKTKFTLVSKYDAYPNCVVEVLDIPTDLSTQSVLRFDMSIVQIRSATTQFINIVQTDNVAEFKKDDAAKTQNTGRKNGEDGSNTALQSLTEYLSSQGAPEAKVIEAVTGGTNGSN